MTIEGGCVVNMIILKQCSLVLLKTVWMYIKADGCGVKELLLLANVKLSSIITTISWTGGLIGVMKHVHKRMVATCKAETYTYE